MRNYHLLTVAALLMIIVGTLGCIFPGDAGLTLTVVNQSTQPVVAYVNGRREGTTGACTTHAFASMTVEPGGSPTIRIESEQGATVQETTLHPAYVEGEAHVTITVPGQCDPAITPVS